MNVGKVDIQRPPKVLQKTNWGMVRYAGVALQTGANVDVVQVPWEVAGEHQDSHSEMFDYFEALKELTLSRYWPKFLGQDLVSRREGSWMYLTPTTGVTLRKFLQCSGPLKESEVLFKYFSREILCALVDYFDQCSFAIADDITPNNVHVCDNGLRVLLRKVHFSGARGESHDEEVLSSQGVLFRNHSHCNLNFFQNVLKLLYFKNSLISCNYSYSVSAVWV